MKSNTLEIIENQLPQVFDRRQPQLWPDALIVLRGDMDDPLNDALGANLSELDVDLSSTRIPMLALVLVSFILTDESFSRGSLQSGRVALYPAANTRNGRLRMGSKCRFLPVT